MSYEQIINKTKEVRGEDFKLDMSNNLQFLRLALETNDVDLVDICLDIYQGESVQFNIKENLSF